MNAVSAIKENLSLAISLYDTPLKKRSELDLKAEQAWPCWEGMRAFQGGGATCAKPEQERVGNVQGAEDLCKRSTRMKGCPERGMTRESMRSRSGLLNPLLGNHLGNWGQPPTFQGEPLGRAHAAVQNSPGILMSSQYSEMLKLWP